MDMDDMDSGRKIRSRSGNWLEEDKELLKELIRERVEVLENKNTNTNANHSKKTAWEDLINVYNTMCIGCHRSVTQAKAQWNIMKMNKKKEAALARKELFKTGGGPTTSVIQTDPKDITAWLPAEFEVTFNDVDSDRICSTAQINLDEQLEINAVSVVEDYEKNVGNQNVLCELTNIQEVTTGKVQDKNFISKTPSKKKRKRSAGEPSTNVRVAIAHNHIECAKEEHEAKMEIFKIKQDLIKLKSKVQEEKLLYYKDLRNQLS